MLIDCDDAEDVVGVKCKTHLEMKVEPRFLDEIDVNSGPF